MKMFAVLFSLIALSACATAPPVVKTPDLFEHKFSESVYIEVHNTPSHCLIRIWDLKASEEQPQAIFRGPVGKEACRIYSMINPEGLQVEENDPVEGCQRPSEGDAETDCCHTNDGIDWDSDPTETDSEEN